MRNRLLMIIQQLAVCTIFVICAYPKIAFSQFNQFIFSYPGPDTIAVGSDCMASLSPLMGTPNVTSNVPGLTITESYYFGSMPAGTVNTNYAAGNQVTVYWFVKNSAGVDATFQFMVTFVDRTPPIINHASFPDDITVASVASAPSPPILSATDNCTPSANLLFNYSETSKPPLCQAGTYDRIFAYTDAAGNIGTWTQTVHVQADIAPPTITYFPTNSSGNCNNNSVAYNSWVSSQLALFTQGASDASGVNVTTNAISTLPYGCNVAVTVNFKARDNCNFELNYNATYSTNDTEKPSIISPPKDTLVYCSNTNYVNVLANWIATHGGATATDNCVHPDSLQWIMEVFGDPIDSAALQTFLKNDVEDECDYRNYAGNAVSHIKGLAHVSFYVKDNCNSRKYVAEVDFAVRDTTAPVVTGSMTTENCGGGDDQQNLTNWINNYGNAVATDGCSPTTWDKDYTYITSGGVSGSGRVGFDNEVPTIVRTGCSWYVDVIFEAKDDCDNRGFGMARWELKDLTGPQFVTVPDNDTLYCITDIPTNMQVTAVDNCSSNPLITQSVFITNGTCSGRKTIQLIWTAVDSCLLSTMVVRTFEVMDTSRPIITQVPADITLSCNFSSLPPLPMLGSTLLATDACSGISHFTVDTINTRHPDVSSCGNHNYLIYRRFMVFDSCGNSNIASQRIAVIDTSGPLLTGIEDTTILCTIMDVVAPPSAVDGCGGPVSGVLLTNQTIIAGTCSDTYTIKKIWQSNDVCNNLGSFEQNIHVVDSVPPILIGLPANITVDCGDIPPPPTIGQTILIVDNCDESPNIIYQEIITRDPNPENCAHYNYSIQRNWTASDNCGNAKTYSQIILVQDNTAPIVLCSEDITIPNTVGSCFNNIPLPPPLSISDECTSSSQVVDLVATVSIQNTSGMPSNDVAVDTVKINIVTPNIAPTQPVISSAILEIQLDKVDAEQTSEFFRIYDEDGLFLGFTNPTNIQCGNSTTSFNISAVKLNGWLVDGSASFTLVPEGTGGIAVNAICPNGRVVANLKYTYAAQSHPLVLSFSIDDGITQPYPSSQNFELSSGDHTIRYIAEDCSGNIGQDSLKVTVIDIEPASFTSPANIQVANKNTACYGVFSLPFPLNIADNCSFPSSFQYVGDLEYLTFAFDPNVQNIPQPTSFTIPNAIPNALGIGQLRVKHNGDNANIGEFFKIYGENNTFIGNTTNGTLVGECNTEHTSTLNIPVNLLNLWAANGNINITAIANNDAGNFTDFIHPCGTLKPNKKDSISTISIELSYPHAEISYQINSLAGDSLRAGALYGNQTIDSLEVGAYNVLYTLLDGVGNAATKSFPLFVRDTTPPIAICAPTTIFTSASGTAVYAFTPAEIDGGSFDHCSAVNLSVSSTSFTCNMAGNTFPVILTVKDTSGNQSTCTALVKVQNETVEPLHSATLCESDTLFLYSNAPQGPSGNVLYTFQWSGPNGFSSTAENPYIPNADPSYSGNYEVVATGFTGCTTVGNIQLNITGTPDIPAVTATKVNYCLGENIVLKTQQFGGTDIEYSWYSGIYPNGTLLSATEIAQYTIPTPTIGTYNYYAIVSSNGCTSSASNILPISVFAIPAPSVANLALSVCEEQAIALSTSYQAPNTSYFWQGPNGYNSNLAQPPVIQNATFNQAGTYHLVVSTNGCFSDTVYTQVQVRPKPPTPTFQSNSPLCVGSNLKLVANNTAATEFIWTNSLNESFTTTANFLDVPSVDLNNVGLWNLVLQSQNCYSNPSIPINIIVEEYPELTASSNSPLCQTEQIEFTSSSSISNIQYAWTGPSGFASSMPNPTQNGISGVYQLIGTTSAGCADTMAILVEVVPNPIIPSIIQNVPNCSNGMLNGILIPTVFPTNRIYSFSWSGPSNFTSFQQDVVIPNISELNNGAYNLVITDQFGCSSQPQSTTLDISNMPVLPILNNVLPLCQGQNFILNITNANAYNGTNIEYIWETPFGPQTTLLPSLAITNADNFHNGNYTASVSVNGCISNSSALSQVSINAIPPAPIISSNAPLCQNDTLVFATPSISGALYNWSGPAGFTASVTNPILAGVSQINQGNYLLSYSLNGCQSPLSMPHTVSIKPLPNTPIATNNGSVCLDTALDTLQLSIAENTHQSGATYVWYNGFSNQSISTANFSPTHAISNFQGISPGNNGFYTIATLNGCSSPASNMSFVQFDTIPSEIAFAGNDFNACDQGVINLNASSTSIGIGSWSQVSGNSLDINTPTATTTSVTGGVANQNYSFEWSVSNGACVNFSRDTVKVKVSNFIAAESIAFIDSCYVESVQLSAVLPQGTTGTWSQPPNQVAPLNISIASPSDPQTIVTGMNPGNVYYFYWSLADIGCGAAYDTTVVRSIGSYASAGNDINVCNPDGCYTLSASPLPLYESGRWETPHTDLSLSTPNQIACTACNLTPGDNTFFWITNNGVCGNTSRDTITIRYELTPTAVDDTITIPFGAKTNIDVSLNDLLPDDYEIELSAPPIFGSLEKISNGIYRYQPNITFYGEDFFIYKVCNSNCVDECTFGRATINVLEQGDCDVATVFTPNEDNVNDIFYVPCLESDEFPDNDVTIYNEYGNEVFNSHNYKNTWNGTYKGSPLPAGTYFYVIKFNGTRGTLSGFLELVR